jgi:hypothetical protein
VIPPPPLNLQPFTNVFCFIALPARQRPTARLNDEGYVAVGGA